MSGVKDINFQELLGLVQRLPEEERQKLFWALRKQEAYKNSERLQDIIFKRP